MNGLTSMMSVVFSSTAAFVSTELDEFLLLLILFARCSTKGQRISVGIGKYLALIFVSLGSAFFATYLSKLPLHYVGFLGLIPIVMGVKEFFEKEEKSSDLQSGFPTVTFFAVMASTLLICLGGSGDNFAVYIPFFTSLKGFDFLICGILFFVLQLVMLILANLAVSIPVIKKCIKKIGGILIPILLILLGLYILWENGTIAWIFGLFGK